MSIPESAPQQYPEPAAPVRAIHLGADTVIVLDQELALVASSSETDVWHVVEHGHCSCAGYRFRSDCKHLKIAAVALSTGVPTAEDRVAARQDDPQERSFYEKLEAAAAAPPAITELHRRVFEKFQ